VKSVPCHLVQTRPVLANLITIIMSATYKGAGGGDEW